MLAALDDLADYGATLEYETWPVDRRRLFDDLWALALAHLPELPPIDRWVAANAPLTGRILQPWRSVLTAAGFSQSAVQKEKLG